MSLKKAIVAGGVGLALLLGGGASFVYLRYGQDFKSISAIPDTSVTEADRQQCVAALEEFQAVCRMEDAEQVAAVMDFSVPMDVMREIAAHKLSALYAVTFNLPDGLDRVFQDLTRGRGTSPAEAIRLVNRIENAADGMDETDCRDAARQRLEERVTGLPGQPTVMELLARARVIQIGHKSLVSGTDPGPAGSASPASESLRHLAMAQLGAETSGQRDWLCVVSLARTPAGWRVFSVARNFSGAASVDDPQ
jgi:hypothetical protein